jgi:hypothetical protein
VGSRDPGDLERGEASLPLTEVSDAGQHIGLPAQIAKDTGLDKKTVRKHLRVIAKEKVAQGAITQEKAQEIVPAKPTPAKPKAHPESVVDQAINYLKANIKDLDTWTIINEEMRNHFDPEWLREEYAEAPKGTIRWTVEASYRIPQTKLGYPGRCFDRVKEYFASYSEAKALFDRVKANDSDTRKHYNVKDSEECFGCDISCETADEDGFPGDEERLEGRRADLLGNLRAEKKETT